MTDEGPSLAGRPSSRATTRDRPKSRDGTGPGRPRLPRITTPAASVSTPENGLTPRTPETGRPIQTRET